MGLTEPNSRQLIYAMKRFVLLMCVLSLCGTNAEYDIRCPSDILVRNQTELDRYIEEAISFRRGYTDTRCILWILTGNAYQLDIVKLMNIDLQQSDSLILESAAHNAGTMVTINCVGRPLVELFETIQPLSNASLVVFANLKFVRCPIPILIEEVSKVIITNCVFL